ncbi:Vacuolar amino acid transporter [Drechslerella dactyloides]|uniref:Vacuolar amino acid transporter n=1 Tax=Drechslerella dactyloides TaxID=74499 RepID=A0AAD6IVK2_DREDA|nr:Vacuolar amino acid transporter [Drechslerella dactyloides]
MSLAVNYATIPSSEAGSRPVSRGSMTSGTMGSRSNSRRPMRRRKSTSNPYRGEASFSSSVVNLLNTIVGAGVLAMPLAMSHMGMLLGILMICFSGLAAGFGLYLQTKCARYVDRGTASFFTLSQLTYPSAAVVFDGAIAIKCFGVAISYLIIIGDLMPQVAVGLWPTAADVGYLVDRHFWITGFMLIMIPLSFLRRLDSLKYTSFVALVSIGYLVIIVLAHFLRGDTLEARGEVHYLQWAGAVTFFSSFPIMMFSILNEIQNNSKKQTTGVVFCSIGVAASIYTLVAITGYLSFGDNVGGNIIAMYRESIASTIGRAAIVVLVMFSYPLQIHPCRASLHNILKWRPSSSPTSLPVIARSFTAPAVTAVAAEPMTDLRFSIITTVLIVSTYVTAMTVASLERVLAYVGSTGSTSISFILPGLFYWRISRPGPGANKINHVGDGSEDEESDEDDDDTIAIGMPERESAKMRRWLRRGAAVLMGYGFVVMAICLTMNIFFSAKGGHH